MYLLKFKSKAAPILLNDKDARMDSGAPFTRPENRLFPLYAVIEIWRSKTMEKSITSPCLQVNDEGVGEN